MILKAELTPAVGASLVNALAQADFPQQDQDLLIDAVQESLMARDTRTETQCDSKNSHKQQNYCSIVFFCTNAMWNSSQFAHYLYKMVSELGLARASERTMAYMTALRLRNSIMVA